MKEVAYNEYAKEALEGLAKGAFLNVSCGGQDNTMTIGWGSLGYIWRKPVMMVMVRYSRHTYRMLDDAGEFTVSIPIGDDFKKELAFCGSKSGKDINKFDACNLTTLRADKVDAPFIVGCDLHYECKVVYKQAMEPGMIDGELDDKFYQNNDFHVIYYGEILATYVK